MSPADRTYVCLSCLLNRGRQSYSTSLRPASNSNHIPKSASPQSIIFDAGIEPLPRHLQKREADTPEDRNPIGYGSTQRQSQDFPKWDLPTRTNAAGDLKLGASETGRLRRLRALLKKVSASTTTIPSTNLPVSEAVKQSLGTLYLEERAILTRLVETYGERDLTGFSNELHKISQAGTKNLLREENLKKLVKDIQGAEFFGIDVTYKAKSVAETTTTSNHEENALEKKADAPDMSHTRRRRRIRIIQSRKALVRVVASAHDNGVKRESLKLRLIVNSKGAPMGSNTLTLGKTQARTSAIEKSADDKVVETPTKLKLLSSTGAFTNLEPGQLRTVKAQDLTISPVDENVLPVPALAHDLSRVLFNPGVYQLQDPRSRVFNFDPYLQHIMPVTEFDFDALKEYITSSKDETLSKIASERERKYVGSSSSMTGMLVHFHFLLSQWREINTSTLSRGFSEKLKSFTAIQRAPSAIFLRWKNGHYAIDADKEYDSANILMSLGRSMEKLFTLERDEFERYRKSKQTEFSEEERSLPESYHYSEMGKFLMRSQLDAHDPRLPGTGMFDLKTRAVVSIRMNTSRHEEGLGYQIRQRFGDWESYEREFFDMIRSAFLKYSLQVRMGRMDGIFVAFHNVERIFGFQYVSLPELDLHLHGQSDTTLGDQEFKISLAMLEEVFERATQKYPDQSLRFHFETRNTTTPLMYIFAEPVDEEGIRAIQDSRKAEIAKIEERIFGMTRTQAEDLDTDDKTDSEFPHQFSGEHSSPSSSSSTTDADSAFLDSIGKSLEESMNPPSSSPTNVASPNLPSDSPSDSNEVLGMVLTVRNQVNGSRVERPANLEASDEWTVEYTLKEMDRPGKAWDQYSACRNRRKAELSRSNVEQDAAANYYLRKINELAQQGARWRKKQDELDRGKQAVVLYGNGRGTEVL